MRERAENLTIFNPSRLERVRESRSHESIDYESYVINTSVIYGLVRGVSVWMILTGGIALLSPLLTTAYALALLLAAAAVGAAYGAYCVSDYLDTSAARFDELHGYRETLSERAIKPIEDTAPPGRENSFVHVGPRHIARSNMLTTEQRDSFRQLAVGDSCSRRKFEGLPAWAGSNITGIWGDVLGELQRLGFVDDNQKWTAAGYAWAREEHNA